MASTTSKIDIIDSHLHVYDLKVRANFPNQNWSHEFPSKETESAIHMDITQEYAKEIGKGNRNVFLTTR